MVTRQVLQNKSTPIILAFIILLLLLLKHEDFDQTKNQHDILSDRSKLTSVNHNKNILTGKVKDISSVTWKDDNFMTTEMPMESVTPKELMLEYKEYVTMQNGQLEGAKEKLHDKLEDHHSGKRRTSKSKTDKIWWPWRTDNQDSPCVNYSTRFGKQLQRVWLASFPCSGNTWVRYLLEGATGIFTGSVFHDKRLFVKGMLGEYNKKDDGTTVVQKIHKMIPENHLPTVFLIRNLAQAIVSMWKLKKSKYNESHTADVPEEVFHKETFHDHVKHSISRWETLADTCLRNVVDPLYVLNYHHLLSNTTQELRPLLQFLKRPVDEGRMSCISSHLKGSFKRNSSRYFDPFTKEEKKNMDKVTIKINRLLKQRGFPEVPLTRVFYP